MLVFGDAVEVAPAALVLARLGDLLARAQHATPGLDRHSQLVGALIEAGQLAQAVADIQGEPTGLERTTPADDAAMALLVSLARCVAQSWRPACAAFEALPYRQLAACAARIQADTLLRLKRPEGYAYYALYPEAYLDAARHSRSLAKAWRVVGLRSIGTSLSAMVAVGLDAAAPRTVRPIGHPFSRRIQAIPVAPAPEETAYAVVDEGPGQSGSSFMAAAHWLADAGIDSARVHLFTGHPHGPGARTGADARRFWELTPTHPATVDALLDSSGWRGGIAGWVESSLGRLIAPLEDIGSGRWRTLQRFTGPLPPPAHPWQERRKYLAHTAQGCWLVKFAGLGRFGEAALAHARALSAAGFSAEPAGLCHGFLTERWRSDLSPIPQVLEPDLQCILIPWVARYLAFRSHSLPATQGLGADARSLHAMARHNTALALGDAGAGAWDRWGDRPDGFAALDARSRPVRTDNRMQRWEWLTDGRIFCKTDAVDHHAGHDLIGCQDIAWDVAAAIVEFDWRGEDIARFKRCLDDAKLVVDEHLLAFLKPCYLAFQMGYYRMAGDAAGGRDASLEATYDRYRHGLVKELGSQPRVA